ncbi:RBBP9/YdeN family alpha/beta hydrolase [Erwinia sp. V71]|uniref:RBBP9/YdeN family alpha/beta hydrolase n=1 Tax=Erwinia sp. V71 TaxID=3369424 RepID=UPI003F5DFBBB
MNTTFIIVPGYTNSGPQHWQSYLERKYHNVVRVQQDNWDSPQRDCWRDRVQETIEQVTGNIFLIGHSCGAVAISQWAEKYHSPRVQGALLVAPADVDDEHTLEAIKVQRPLALQRLPFPATLVCSDNDEFLRLQRAEWLAAHWSASLVTIAGAGHFHTAAGYGEWLEGERMIHQLSGGQLLSRQ